jgi:hypothetical protein
MLRAFFSYHNPLFYPVLAVVVVALRWPSFDTVGATATEGLLWAAGERLAAGHALYQEVWVGLPPVMPATYALIVWLFGSAGWVVLQLLAICLVVASAYLINGIANTYRLYAEPTVLPGFLLTLVLSAPASRLQFGPELVALPILLLMLQLGLSLTQAARPRPAELLSFGAFAVLAVLTDPVVTLMSLAIVGATLTAEGSSLSRTLTVLGGALLLAFSVGVALAGVGSLSGFSELVREGVQQVVTRTKGAPQVYEGALILALFGPILLMSMIGVWQTRARESGTTARSRLAESVLAVWFAAGLLAMVIQLPELRLSTMQLCAAPISIYSSYWLLTGPGRRQSGIQLLGCCLIVLLPFAQPALRALPAAWVAVWPLNQYLRPAPDLSIQTLRSSLSTYPLSTPVWVLAHSPSTYVELGRKPATRYIDISMYDLRVAKWLDINPLDGIPAPSVEDLFRSMRDEPPTLIVDQGRRFERLAKTLPLVGGMYRHREIGPWTVYERTGP